MPENAYQFRIAHLLVATFFVAASLGLFLVWRNLAIGLSVSVIPATIAVWAIGRFRRDPHSRPFSRSRIASFVSLALLFFVLYFLSVGPAIYYFSASDSMMPFFSAFYQPLEWFNRPSNPLQEVMDWYVIQWEEAAGIARSSRSK